MKLSKIEIDDIIKALDDIRGKIYAKAPLQLNREDFHSVFGRFELDLIKMSYRSGLPSVISYDAIFNGHDNLNKMLNDNKMHQVVMSFDNGKLEYYIDGIKAEREFKSLGFPDQDNYHFNIGEETKHPGFFGKGYITTITE